MGAAGTRRFDKPAVGGGPCGTGALHGQARRTCGFQAEAVVSLRPLQRAQKLILLPVELLLPGLILCRLLLELDLLLRLAASRNLARLDGTSLGGTLAAGTSNPEQ